MLSKQDSNPVTVRDVAVAPLVLIAGIAVPSLILEQHEHTMGACTHGVGAALCFLVKMEDLAWAITAIQGTFFSDPRRVL